MPCRSRRSKRAEQLYAEAKAAVEGSHAAATEVNALVDACRKWEQEYHDDE